MSSRSQLIRFIVYCAVVIRFVVGGYNVVAGANEWINGYDESVLPLLIICGALLAILCGILLFIGAYRNDHTFVLAYLLITTPVLLIITGYLVVMCYLAAIFSALLAISLFGDWLIHIAVFVFYLELKEKYRHRKNQNTQLENQVYQRERTSTF
ncbi:hypothetical protein Zmor_017186 [Zophobas morio]|uniref:Uncharacterized protein n=1 Tax=Zophobas morio TaxID=2755281 RepID=A0AA38MCC8_9CUCU|nr:hypothetical protein Zmor_017186 [Zophobas morio]